MVAVLLQIFRLISDWLRLNPLPNKVLIVPPFKPPLYEDALRTTRGISNGLIPSAILMIPYGLTSTTSFAMPAVRGVYPFTVCTVQFK